MSARPSRLAGWILVPLLGTGLTAAVPAVDAAPPRLAPAPVAPDLASPVTTAATVAGLVRAAQHGASAAGAALITLGLADCLAGVSAEDAACQAWMRGRDGAITAQQVYGIALAQGTLRQQTHLGGLVAPLLQRARAFACAGTTQEPSLLLEQAVLWDTIAPRQRARARAAFLQALLQWPQPGEGAAPPVGALLRAAVIADLLHYPERHALRARAAQAVGAQDGALWHARWLAWVARTDLAAAAHAGRDAGDVAVPPATETAIMDAIRACSADGDAVARADAWAVRVAQLQVPCGDDRARREALIAAWDAEAAALGEAGMPAAQAAAMRTQAQLRGVGLAIGDDGWDEVARCEEAAGAAWDRAGDGVQAATALAAAARARARWDPLRANDRARTLLRQAIQRYEQAGQDLAAERLVAWFSPAGP